jgi:phosphotransferase family enzyme
MCNRVQIEFEVWRLIILRRNASEFLVFETESCFRLPCVEIPAHTRLAQALNDQVKALWGLEVYSLYPLPYNTSGPGSPVAHYHVIEALQYEAVAPPAARWIPMQLPMEGRFIEAEDFAAVQTWIKNLVGRNSTGLSAFDKPGWFFILTDWVQKALRPFQMTLTGGFVQFNASATFSLIRFTTDDDAVWFKAVGEPNLHEFSISVTLARLFPEYLPSLLASDPACHGWLAADAGGPPLNEAKVSSAWIEAATALAGLQTASVSSIDDLLEAGCRDLRAGTLLELVDPFLEVIAKLMQEQSKVPPPILSRQDLSDLATTLKCALHRLQSVGIPDTLGHGDFNSGNILVVSERCVFIDWAEAQVGHPFLTFEYFLAHVRKDYPTIATFETDLRACYSKMWSSIASPEQIAEAFLFSPLVAVYAYAAGSHVWRDSERLKVPGFQGYLRSLTRKMKQAADLLQRRRVECLN